MGKANFAPQLVVLYQDSAWYENVSLDLNMSGYSIIAHSMSDTFDVLIQKLSLEPLNYQHVFIQIGLPEPKVIEEIYVYLKFFFYAPCTLIMDGSIAGAKEIFKKNNILSQYFLFKTNFLGPYKHGAEIILNFLKHYQFQKKILVLDEDDDFRDELCEKLSHFPYVKEVEACDSAAELFTQILEMNRFFDILVMDMDLPGSGLNILEVLQKLKKISTSYCMAKILTGNYSDPEILLNADVLGINEVVDKPFDVDFLSQKILNLCAPKTKMLGLAWLPDKIKLI